MTWAHTPPNAASSGHGDSRSGRWRRPDHLVRATRAAKTCSPPGHLTWAVAIFAFLNILLTVTGEESYWIGASPAEVLVGQHVDVAIQGAGFLVGATDYYCRFETAIVNPFIGEFEVRDSPLVILAGNAAKCTTPAWDLPATQSVLKVVKADAYVRKEGSRKRFEFLPALSRSEPSSGPSAGAQLVTFSGYGFGALPGTLYTSTFTGNGGRKTTSGPCTLVGNSVGHTIVCEAPSWPYPAGPTAVTIRNNNVLIPGNLRTVCALVHCS